MSQPTEPTAVNPYTASADPAPPLPPALAVPLEGEIREQFQRGKNGAGWFYWIAALSLINSLMVLSGSDRSFALGLGLTLISDSIAVEASKDLGQSAIITAGVFDAFVLGLIVLCGWLSQKRILTVFALGMVLYLLDGLLCLMLGSIMCIAIHGFALWSMWSGFMAFRQLNALERKLGTAGAGGGL